MGIRADDDKGTGKTPRQNAMKCNLNYEMKLDWEDDRDGYGWMGNSAAMPETKVDNRQCFLLFDW